MKEVHYFITQLKDKKTPGYDNINSKIIKELPIKAIRFLTIIINAVFHLNHFPSQWKVAQIILILKPGRISDHASSYRPISLLPIMSKICQKIILKRLNKIINVKKLIPDHQFGFRNHYTTIEQVNRLTFKIREAIENKKYCTAAFLDVEKAFDKVWHKGLLKKLKRIFPKNLYKLLKSYLTNRFFQVKINETLTNIFPIKAGVPQGSVLGPTLYLLYTADLPVAQDITAAMYADDTAILSINSCPKDASVQLQKYIDELQKWFRQWRIKINETKSTQITFALRKKTCPPVTLNGKLIPQNNEVKYLGIHLDRRLTWRSHIWSKRKQLNLKFRKMYWLLGRNSQLTLENKILIYTSILKPIWTYGIELWGTSANSNIEIIERFQSKILRNIVNAPWFVPNNIIRNDLKIPTVKEEILTHYNRYYKRLFEHPNQLASELTATPKISRLKKYKNIL